MTHHGSGAMSALRTSSVDRLISSSPACAQPSSSLPPGAPLAPMEPMTSLSNRQDYQCAWNSASTVAVPESNEPAIAMAEGMPFGSSRLIMAATNTAATGRTITK